MTIIILTLWKVQMSHLREAFQHKASIKMTTLPLWGLCCSAIQSEASKVVLGFKEIYCFTFLLLHDQEGTNVFVWIFNACYKCVLIQNVTESTLKHRLNPLKFNYFTSYSYEWVPTLQHSDISEIFKPYNRVHIFIAANILCATCIISCTLPQKSTGHLGLAYLRLPPEFKNCFVDFKNVWLHSSVFFFLRNTNIICIFIYRYKMFVFSDFSYFFIFLWNSAYIYCTCYLKWMKIKSHLGCDDARP